jgi:hypothetical protein
MPAPFVKLWRNRPQEDPEPLLLVFVEAGIEGSRGIGEVLQPSRPHRYTIGAGAHRFDRIGREWWLAPLTHPLFVPLGDIAYRLLNRRPILLPIWGELQTGLEGRDACINKCRDVGFARAPVLLSARRPLPIRPGPKRPPSMPSLP